MIVRPHARLSICTARTQWLPARAHPRAVCMQACCAAATSTDRQRDGDEQRVRSRRCGHICAVRAAHRQHAQQTGDDGQQCAASDPQRHDGQSSADLRLADLRSAPADVHSGARCVRRLVAADAKGTGGCRNTNGSMQCNRDGRATMNEQLWLAEWRKKEKNKKWCACGRRRRLNASTTYCNLTCRALDAD